jgi:DNA-binding PadR family transcriptional regulator
MDKEKVLNKYLPMTETAFYILLSLYEPKHGYGIIKEVEILTEKRIIIGSGTVYGTLSKMEKDGIVVVYSNEERKTIYEITDLGRKLITLEIKRLEELNNNAKRLGGRFDV